MKKIFNGNEVRIFEKKSEPWFSASDVCNILGLTNVTLTLKGIDNQDNISTTKAVDSIGRESYIYLINEAGLYEIIFKSRKHEAKQFRRWVFEEVLPSIRKTGKYAIGEELRSISKKNRRMITDSWKECGIDNPKDYARLTMEEYRALRFPSNERKADFDKEKILLLSALESMEALNLHYNPVEGFFEAKTSIHTTANKIQSITHQNNKELQ